MAIYNIKPLLTAYRYKFGNNIEQVTIDHQKAADGGIEYQVSSSSTSTNESSSSSVKRRKFNK